MTEAWVAYFLAADKTVQGFSMAINLFGTILSCGLTLEAWRSWNEIRQNGYSELRRLLARQSFLTQGSILLIQLSFLGITLLVLTLPTIPVYAMGSHITEVIALRKILRLFMTLILALQAWAARSTRMKVWAVLEQEGHSH